MGFYGKVNRTDSNFVIDKIYPNRKTMDENINSDKVFIGRYVLIEYEQKGQETYLQLYKDPEAMDFYFDSNLNTETRARYTENKNLEIGDYFIELHEIIYILDNDNKQIFYKCNGKTADGFATFVELSYSPLEIGTYHNNYQIDIGIYGESRGFDSTVWQKIYVDDVEKYVMIAELNSVVPTFDITVDAPTFDPIPPHFDSDSNNVYYKLHVQPTWGFKVKEATDKNLSDEKVTGLMYKWNDTTKTLNPTWRDYDGAIYFNKDGFDSDYHYNSSDKDQDNFIKISTEASGRKYNNSHGGNNDDIQALEIMLPGIGQALTELWDLTYGKGEAIDGDETKKARNKEVNWDIVTGLRLVKTSRNPEISGFEYDTVGIDTIAGCINSVHDLIGMIIVNDKDGKLAPEDALVNRIYYRNGQYWIKDLTYDYVPVSNENQKIENMQQFDNSYYYKNGNNYYKELEGYQAGNQYYAFNDKVVTKVDLCQEEWEPNTYYYFEDNNYKLDPSDYPDETKTYFKISQDLNKVENVVNNKIGESNLCFFPNSYSNETYNVLFPTVKATISTSGKGLFYKGKDANGKTGYLPFEQGKVKYTPGIQLSYFDGYQIELSTTTSGAFIETYEFSKAEETVVNTVEFKNNTYYSQDNVTKEWVLLESEATIDLDKQYYQFGQDGIEKIEIKGKFYEPKLYHYLDYVDYIMDNDEKREPGIDYYYINEDEIKAVSKDTVFYEPNKYYYFNGTSYVVDTAETMTEGREYYRDIYTRYVHPNSPNKDLAPGSIWNELVTKIPEGIQLANRKETYTWKQLNGFSRTLNTINGLILKINNLLKSEDKLTRDNKTVQGCINQMNDIIHTIGSLNPSNFIGVDEYGRMTSMKPVGDSWIDVSVNKDNNDSVIINHIGPVAKDARNEGNKEPLFGETFEIEDWVFDDKGHKTNVSVHTVKIPQGKLTAAAVNGSDVVTQLDFIPSTGEIKTTREDIVNLKLNSYTKNSDNNDVTSTDTLGGALSKLQTQIIEEETARTNAISNTMDNLNQAIEKEVADRNAAIKVETDARIEAVNKEIADRQAAINALDATLSTETSAEVITSITQTDGKLTSINKTTVGNLTLNGWTLGENVVNNESIADTDTVNNAFAKAQRQINANKVALAVLNGNSTTKGSVAYQIAEMVIKADGNGIDKLEEIAAWIVNDTTGAAKMNSDIKANADAIDTLELLVGNTAVATQIAEAINNALIMDGGNKYALAADLVNLSNTVSNINGRVEDLELAVSAEKIAQWDAAEVNVQSDWMETDETADSYIKNKPALDFVPMETYNALLERIAALEARIEALENPVVEEPTPDPENPEEPVE